MQQSIANLSDLKAILDAIGWERIAPLVPLLVRILAVVRFFFPPRDHAFRHRQLREAAGTRTSGGGTRGCASDIS